MRVLVTGTRDVPNQFSLVTILTQLDDWLRLAGGKMTLVHGDCPTGVDAAAAHWATQHPGVTPEPHPADWDKFGKAAGAIRNSYMVSLGADICLGWPGPGSKGTWDCLKKAVDAGISTYVTALV